MNDHYYSGGLAELVSKPTQLTLSYFQRWLTGATSFGTAMKLLGLPYQSINQPLVTFHNSELVVDLQAEENTLYQKTLFNYAAQASIDSTPHLHISFSKILHPKNIFHTLTILWKQSVWIAQPKETVEWAQKMVEAVPTQTGADSSSDEISSLLEKEIWPAVIAVGMLAEFYHQLASRSAAIQSPVIQNYISSELSQKDWFFQSIADQWKVAVGQLSLEEYLALYGMRADRDYELTCPRWHEIPDEMTDRIKTLPVITPHEINENSTPDQALLNLSASDKKIVTAMLQMQIIRSEAKKKALVMFGQLRLALLSEGKMTNIESNDRKQLSAPHQHSRVSGQKSGTGLPVSTGIVAGQAYHLSSPNQIVPSNRICIFPNASPEFARQYPHCAGMIFCKGGQTSHGSVVAREFQIPALIDGDGAGIEDDVMITLNCTSGTWEIT